jgi:hypothetical protein
MEKLLEEMFSMQSAPRLHKEPILCGSKVWSWVPLDLNPGMTALSRNSISCKRQTRTFVREGAPHQQTRKCLTVTKICSWAPDGSLTPRYTGRLTVGRNISLTLTCELLPLTSNRRPRFETRTCLGQNTNLGHGSRGDWSQEWLCWRRPAV